MALQHATLTGEELRDLDAYWRAANYLAVGQMYLRDNPLLRRPLLPTDIKHMILGHWGTTPGQNFIYTHLNRVIRQRDVDMIYVCGPGHGGPAVIANAWLEGTWSEVFALSQAQGCPVSRSSIRRRPRSRLRRTLPRLEPRPAPARCARCRAASRRRG